MKKILQYKTLILGVLYILVFCVSATAGISYSKDERSITVNLSSIIGNILSGHEEAPIGIETWQETNQRAVLEPGTLMLLGLGLVGLAFIAKMGISRQ